MTLEQYLTRKGMTATKLASECGVAVSTITRAANGETIPTPELMTQIVQVTKGKVKPNDFYNLVEMWR